MIERGRAPAGIDIVNGRHSFFDRFTGDKPGGQFFEKTEPGGKVFEAFLTREVDQRASR